MTYIDYEETEGVGYSMVFLTSMTGLSCWKCGTEVQPNIEHRCGSTVEQPKPAKKARRRKSEPTR
jgi:hypothetical protein